MKVDIQIVKQVLFSLDPEASIDPEFEQTLDQVISEIVRKQKAKNEEKFNKKRAD